MNDDQTPINARPKRRSPEALEDLSLALRDRVLWPLGDSYLGLSDGARAAVAGGAVVLALAIGVGGFSLASSGDGETATPAPTVAVTAAPAPQPTPVKAEPKAKPEPTLQGAAPVFKAPKGEDTASTAEPESGEATAVTSAASNTGNAATDRISSQPGATTATTARASTATESVDGPPAGPAAIAVARKFADAFVVYETGGGASEVRRAFKATATPGLTKALMQRPPRQPAGVEVPKAKVLNVVPAPSHDKIYPVSVSLLRVGVTSELRLEMEQLKNKNWRVVNVLG